VRAAVENGADAIYFGLDRFNARMRAKNFTLDGLPGLMAFLHRRGVRGYVTFNTLVFTGELAAAADFARAIIAAGADAAIVQDAGICRLIRRLSPDFPIHASTQMTVTSAAGVEFARGLGAHLVVLARENTLADINAIQEAQRASGAPPLPLEVFVHGALCVAYSGQCLTSESLGGRSANRGECAQACRLPYELVCDGRKVDLGDRRYLLSPRDLAGLDVLPDLVRAGVASLKIEGRLKSPEYVASITRVYRRALDEIFLSTAAAVSAQPGATRLKPDCVAPDAATGAATGALPGAAHAPAPAAAAVRYELEMSFSRGLHTGWFRGIDNRLLVHARFGTKRGVFLGEILGVRHESVTLRPAAPLKPGDGVVFDAGDPGQREEGGRIYEMDTARDGGATLRFGRGDIDFRRVRPGQLLWKTNDPALDRELRATYEGGKIRRASPVSLEVRGHAGAPLTLIARDTEGRAVRVDSATPLAPAQTRPLTAAGLRDQFARLGGTPFRLGALATHLEGGVMLPVSELNRLRREAIAGLDALRAQPRRWTLHETDDDTAAGAVAPPAPGSARVPRADEGRPRPSQKNPAQTADGGTPPVSPRDAGAPQSAATVPATAGAGTTATIAAPAAAAPSPEIIPVLRDPVQLDAALAVPGLATFYCEFENPKHYRDAVARFRAWQSTPPDAPQTSIWVAPPRITKPGEEWILRQVRSCEADGYLVRNPDHLAFFAADRKRGDFSLNIANPPAAGYFLARHGLERVTASYDLNLAQLEALLSAAPPAWFDLTIHQRMPMFHMEHCVFCAFLSAGKKDYRDCGRPCEKHEVRLRDRTGAEFPLKADAGCRNTVFNNRAQTGAESVARLLALGARFFRVEFVNETPAEVAHTLRRYQQLLRGEITGPALWRELRLLNQLGVTRGQMER
jgi:putative protease